MDIRIILFLIVFFYAISLSKEGFDPKPVLDGTSIEENLSVNDFLSGSTHKNSNQDDIDKIYDVFDEFDNRIKEIDEALDIYEEDICKDGNCISCNLPSPTEQYEIDTENCGLFTPEVGNIISLNSTCQFKCKSGFTEIIGSNKPGFCTIDPSPINKFTGKLNPYPSIQCSQDQPIDPYNPSENTCATFQCPSGTTRRQTMIPIQCNDNCTRDQCCSSHHPLHPGPDPRPDPPPDPSSDGIQILNQNRKTIQIVNTTEQDPLHVFIIIPKKTYDNIIKYDNKYDFNNLWVPDNVPGSDSNEWIGPMVNWGEPRGPSGNNAWDPIGDSMATEIKIPKNEKIVIKIPDILDPDINNKLNNTDKSITDQFGIMAVRLDKPHGGFFGLNDSQDLVNHVYFNSQHYATKFEGGLKVGNDLSAVDGVNFNVDLELLSDNKSSYNITSINFEGNPCKNLNEGYMYGDADDSILKGCVSPFHSCGPNPGLGDKAESLFKNYVGPEQATCTCPEHMDQVCKFNKCSKNLFRQPLASDPARSYWTSEDLDPGNPTAPVKKYINDANNLKPDSDLYKYCKNIQGEIIGDSVVPYCYDYNDTHSTAYLFEPYKIKLIFSNFTN